MIRIKNHKQQDLFDPWSFLSPKRRKLLDQSWAGLFREELLNELPVNEFASNFKEGFGRPTKELHTALGALVIQQTQDVTDEETVNQLAFNTQWHYALNITEESDSAKYISTKTLWTMRDIVYQNSLDEILFEKIRDKLAKVFKVNTDNQRIDSVHIKSNMKRLGRISIFVTSINKFFVNLKRKHKELFGAVNSDIIEKYLPEKALKCFAMIKPSQSVKTLTSVSADLFDLAQQFKDHPEVKNMHSYKLLERVLNEQCNLDISDNTNPVTIKPPKEIPSDSLQNPSDPDARIHHRTNDMTDHTPGVGPGRNGGPLTKDIFVAEKPNETLFQEFGAGAHVFGISWHLVHYQDKGTGNDEAKAELSGIINLCIKGDGVRLIV